MEFIALSQSLLKIMLLALFGVYIVFAGVMVRQESLMSRVVLVTSVAPLLKIIIWIHFILSLSLFFLTVVLL